MGGALWGGGVDELAVLRVMDNVMESGPDENSLLKFDFGRCIEDRHTPVSYVLTSNMRQ